LQPATSTRTPAAVLPYALTALVALACFVALGRYVITAGEPSILLGWERALFDHSTLVAWWLTWACYADALIPICIVLLLLAWRFQSWRARLVFAVISLLVSWRAADFAQRFFERVRPAAWVVKHETSFSYPSSHAAICAGFYALLAVMLYSSDLPKTPRVAASAALLLFALAVCWSRLALGAHYITDLLGGIVLGTAVAAAALCGSRLSSRGIGAS
jgi:undecaprenyl-diphosphatase